MIVNPLPPAVMRRGTAARSEGQTLAGRPFMRLPGSKSRRSTRPRWMPWLWVLLGLGLLSLAPLVANSQGLDSLVVTWTAPGDDGGLGTAASYDLRVSAAPISEANFDAATAVQNLPAPGPAGTRQSATARALARGTTYYFAIRTTDEAGNRSEISNVLRWDWILDTAPPSAPRGLAARRDQRDVRVTWSAGAEPDLGGYHLYRSMVAAGPFVKLTGEPLAAAEYLDSGIPEGATAVWYQVSAVDATGNESARSASVSVVLATVTAVPVIEGGFPNPSRIDAPVQIPLVMPANGPSEAVIDIVDAGGRRVRRIERVLSPGRQEVTWDGRNDAARRVAPGVYRAWLIAGSTRASVRLLRVP